MSKIILCGKFARPVNTLFSNFYVFIGYFLYPRIDFSWTLTIAMNQYLNALLFILQVYESELECHIISSKSLQFGISMPYFIGN